MKKTAIGVTILNLALAGVTADLPTYLVQRASGPITLDGIPSEPSWAAADTIKFRLTTDQGPNAQLSHYDFQRRVWANILWDPTNIYFYCWADEDTIWAFHQTRDYWGYWNEIAFEYFFDPDGNGLDFAEIQVTPHGDITDLIDKVGYTHDQASFDFDGIAAGVKVYGTLSSDWRTDAELNSDIDTGFGVELAIPFKSFDKKII
jgi:hypothetical protein